MDESGPARHELFADTRQSSACFSFDDQPGDQGQALWCLPRPPVALPATGFVSGASSAPVVRLGGDALAAAGWGEFFWATVSVASDTVAAGWALSATIHCGAPANPDGMGSCNIADRPRVAGF